jgi:hypothetical protein
VKGESTAWYASFWRFCAAYLKERFGTEWCFSPEQSLSLEDNVLCRVRCAETYPFTDKPSLVMPARETSPYVNRIRLLWQRMRAPVIDRFPKAPGLPCNIEAYMKHVNDAYVTDAYHWL